MYRRYNENANLSDVGNDEVPDYIREDIENIEKRRSAGYNSHNITEDS